MKKHFLTILCFGTMAISSKAACYEICSGGLSYTFITDDAGIDAATCTLNDPPACEGEWVYECPAIVGPPDEDATLIMMSFNPTKLRPCTPAELELLSRMLKGNVPVRYLDLKRIPKSTIDFLQSH